MARTTIEWTRYSWNPITGCSKLSVGCQHCYAAKMAHRLKGRFGYPADQPFRPGVFHQETCASPSFPTAPTPIFVCSMGDIGHEAVRPGDVAAVFATMRRFPQHRFMLLTKRPARLLRLADTGHLGAWPPHVWMGVTVEHSLPPVLERLDVLLQLPARIHFVSVEPLLGSVDLTPWLSRLDWVICGAETGKQARPCAMEWVRQVRDQCVESHVPFFFKKFADGCREIDGQRWEQQISGVDR